MAQWLRSLTLVQRVSGSIPGKTYFFPPLLGRTHVGCFYQTRNLVDNFHFAASSKTCMSYLHDVVAVHGVTVIFFQRFQNVDLVAGIHVTSVMLMHVAERSMTSLLVFASVGLPVTE